MSYPYQKHIWVTKEVIRREYLQNIEDGIYDEQQDRVLQEGLLNDDIVAESNRAKRAEQTLTNDLDAEVTRATGTESEIASDLADEITRATGKESELSDDVDSLNDRLASEITRATAAEGNLSTLITNEGTRATEAESILTTNLASEVSRAQGAEGTLATNLANEVSRARGAESALHDYVDQQIAAVYHPKGTITFANLPALTAANLNNVYNVSDSFITTADFKEGAGKSYPAGSNVAIINDGTTANPVYKYDVLAGFVDLSPYAEKSSAHLTSDDASTNIDDADYFPFYDTSASAKKKSLWSNIVSKMKAAFGIASGGTGFLKKDGTWTNPTKSEIGLGNVPNVATNDQTPTYTAASSLTALSSGEKLSTAFGKLAKGISDLISHIGNTSNPHSVTKSQVGLGDVGNFKAVSTVANQGLTEAEKQAARANIGAGSESQTITVDTALSTTSENPVQNKVITNDLNTRVKKYALHNYNNTYCKLGTCTNFDNSKHLELHLNWAQGYGTQTNANQQKVIDIYVEAGNNATVGNNSWAEYHVVNKDINNSLVYIKWLSYNSFELYIGKAYYNGTGYYTVISSDGVTWTHSNSDAGTDIPDGAIRLAADKQVRYMDDTISYSEITDTPSVDSTPTSGSSNLITSGGVYNYIDTMITQALAASY